MYEGYFDESGDLDTPPRVFCLSGYYLSKDCALDMDERWRALLKLYNVPYFHMVDCAHGNPPFDSLGKDDRISLVTECIALIKQYTFEGFSILCHGNVFQASERFPDVYSFCVSLCMRSLRSFIQLNRLSGEVQYFFETGHKNRGRAYRFVADQIAETGAPVTFARKEDNALLQAADLLAWQTAKYVKDSISGAREPRRDFLSLMRHPHSVAYARFEDDGELSIAMEMWPAERRSPRTVSLSFDDSMPLRIMYENNDTLPILPVEASLGWRTSYGGRMTYVAFKQLVSEKPFAIAFDEPRLLEAIGMLIAATGAYPESDLQVALTPKTVGIQAVDDGVILTAMLLDGGKVGIRIPRHILKDLIDRLRSEGGTE